MGKNKFIEFRIERNILTPKFTFSIYSSLQKARWPCKLWHGCGVRLLPQCGQGHHHHKRHQGGQREGGYHEVKIKWLLDQDFLNWEYFSQFSDDICENLKGKPKLFLFPTCRGQRRDFGIIGKLSSSKTLLDIKRIGVYIIFCVLLIVFLLENNNLHLGATRSGSPNPGAKYEMFKKEAYSKPQAQSEWKDMLTVYSTFPLSLTIEENTTGPMFVQCFCRVSISIFVCPLQCASHLCIKQIIRYFLS